MKKWNIEFNPVEDKVIELLKYYAKSLVDESYQKLNVIIETEVIQNKIYYFFKVLGKYNKFNINIFEISMIDLGEFINLKVCYYNDTENISTSKKYLEEDIDKIISSEKMGKYISYLINIDSLKN